MNAFFRRLAKAIMGPYTLFYGTSIIDKIDREFDKLQVKDSSKMIFPRKTECKNIKITVEDIHEPFDYDLWSLERAKEKDRKRP